MINKVIKISCIIFLVLNISVAEMPDWAKSSKHPQYPSSLYLIGIGAGDSREAADDKARADLLKQIRVKISSEINIEEMEISKKDKSYLSSKVESNTKSVVKGSASGIKIGDRAKTNGTHYSLAVLEKDNYQKSLENQIEKITESTKSLINNGREKVKKGNIFSALEDYKVAREIIPEYYIKNNLMTSVIGKSYSIDSSYSPEEIFSEMQDIVSKITLKIISGINQTAEAGNYLSEEIHAKVLYNNTGVSNFPVNAKYPNGEIIDKKRTDQEGNVSFRIKALSTNISGKEGKAILSLDQTVIPENLRELLPTSKIEILYNIKTPDLSFNIEIKNKQGGNLQSLSNKLKNIITGNGYKIDSKSNLVINGRPEIVNTKEMSTAFGKQYIVNIKLNLQMIDKNSDNVITSYNIDEKALSKASEEDAFNKAINNISINQEKFISFLNKAANQ